MYTLTVHANQVMLVTHCAVSLAETTDDGNTYHLATAVSSSDLLASSEEDPLWVFIQQVSDALSSALGADGRLYRSSIEHDRVDGGWGGAGQMDPPEQSEDR